MLSEARAGKGYFFSRRARVKAVVFRFSLVIRGTQTYKKKKKKKKKEVSPIFPFFPFFFSFFFSFSFFFFLFSSFSIFRNISVLVLKNVGISSRDVDSKSDSNDKSVNFSFFEYFIRDNFLSIYL